MAFRQTTFDPTTFTVAKHWDDHHCRCSTGFTGMSGSIEGISHYLNQGKKLIVYHGWDDPLCATLCECSTLQFAARDCGCGPRRTLVST